MFRRLPQIFMLLLLPIYISAEPIFDTHLHYSGQDTRQFSPRDIIDILARNEVHHAVVTSAPASHTLDLYHHALKDKRVNIIPLLGAYRDHGDKANWTKDLRLPERIEAALQQGKWQGIGELHIFANDRHSPVLRRIVELATAYKLPLLLHCDPAVIDSVYEISANQTVIWAHAGTFPYPELVADYLERYPALMVDLSVRDERIAPNGQISDEWYELFVKKPRRFMIGVDTFSTSRWHDFDKVVKTINQWLSQLPDDVAQQLRYSNASSLYLKHNRDQ